jgi:hypothetical protein
MRALYPMLLLFLLAVGVSGQTVASPAAKPGVEVIQQKWGVEVRNPLLDEDPFKAINDTQQMIRDQKETLRQEELRRRQGLPPEPRKTRVAFPEAAKQTSSTAIYTYEIKVKNTGEKAIQTFIWDYVFLEPGTEQELGRLRFESKTNIAPGKTRHLVMRTVSPPTGSISAKNAGKKIGEQYSEHVVIQSIQFADGSAWQLQ